MLQRKGFLQTTVVCFSERMCCSVCRRDVKCVHLSVMDIGVCLCNNSCVLV